MVARVADDDRPVGCLGDTVWAVEAIGIRRALHTGSRSTTIADHGGDSPGRGVDSADRVVFRVDDVNLPGTVEA